MAVAVLWALRRVVPVITMAPQGVVDVQVVGHKHQVVMEELTQAAAAAGALITTVITKGVMVVRGLLPLNIPLTIALL